MRTSWVVSVVLAGCITGRGLSDDDFNPGAPTDATDDTESNTQAAPISLTVEEADGPDDPCTTSAPTFDAAGETGRIRILQAGVEMGECVGWTPVGIRESDLVTIAYEPDSGDGNCPTSCPHDFEFTVAVPAGDYTVVWHDEEVTVTVD